MTYQASSFLLIGESDVGKTHYGAQLLRRLNTGNGAMTLDNSDNLEPFVETMDQISRGLAARHTPRRESTLSRWTVVRKRDGRSFDLNWPDYGGEQISSMINERRMPLAWRNKIANAAAWAFMVRPSQVRLPGDAFTRQVRLPAADTEADSVLSPQSRLVEILQMLRFKTSAYSEDWYTPPPLCVLLSCYDELNTDLPPGEYCDNHLPMLASYLGAHWPGASLKFFGISPLGRALSDSDPDKAFAAAGPDKMGFVISEDGELSDDLLAPIDWMLNASQHC